MSIGVVSLDPGAVTATASVLGGLERGVSDAAGGVNRSMPAVPDGDDHGVAAAFIAFDEAREHFDRGFAQALAATANTLSGLVVAGDLADRNPFGG